MKKNEACEKRGWILGVFVLGLLTCAFVLVGCGDDSESGGKQDQQSEDVPQEAHVPESALAIKPAPLAQDFAEFKLPDSFDDVAVGASGRFLILHLNRARKLAIFDVNEAKVIKYLPLASDNVVFTAGAEKLFVVHREKRIIERYDLVTLERELTQSLPLSGIVNKIAMGSGAVGPLLVTGGEDYESEIAFLDPLTFSKLDVQVEGSRGTDFGAGRGELTVSSDGRTFAFWRHGLSPTGVYCLVYGGSKAKINYEHDTVGGIYPSQDGLRLYTGDGTRSLEGRPTDDEPARLHVPAVHGNFTLTFTGGNDREEDRAVAIHIEDEERPLVSLPEVKLPGSSSRARDGGLRTDQRAIFIPDANLLVTVPDSRDRLLLHTVDIDQALAESGIDYLFVSSRPPLMFEAGERYVYQMTTKSKAGSVEYALEAGPQGMKISPSGLLTWQVPSTTAFERGSVIVLVSDGSGQQVFHTFELTKVGAESKVVARDEPVPEPIDTPIPPRPVPPRPDPPVVRPDFPVTPPMPEPAPPKPVVPAPVLPDPVLPEITPLEMANVNKEVTLPGAFNDLVLGGGGRYIVLHLKTQSSLGVFDVSAGKVVKFIPVPGDDILFAANADSLVLLLRDKKMLQRWSLTDFERTLEKSIEEPEDPSWMVMGSASAGPLVMGGSKDSQDRTVFYDPATFERLVYASDENRPNRSIPGQDGPQVRVSANGRVITAWRKDLSPAGLYYAGIEGGSLVYRYDHATVGYIQPSPDGLHLYTGEGIYTPELKPLRPGDRRVTSYAIPAVHGSFYLKIPAKEGPRRDEKPDPATLHLMGDARPLVTLQNVRVNAGRSIYRSREDLSLEKRLIYVPDAQVAVTYPEERDRLVLHRIDLDEELKKSGIDYLFVTSLPDSRVSPGETWSYTPDIRSKNEVTLSLESAPAGMKVSGKQITWDVPDDAPSSAHLVVVSVKDTTGQELIHNFSLAVGDAVPGVAPAAVPPKPVSKPMKPSQDPAIKAPDLGGKEHVSFKLPAVISDLDVGGDGRFLVMNFPSLQKLGIFDVNAAEIVKLIPVSDENLHFSAGLGKLVIIEGEKRLVSRWDLHSFEREAVSSLEVDGPVRFAAMGSGSEGPLVIGTGEDDRDTEAHFYDLASLRKSELERSGEHDEISGNFRASANGRVFTSWSSNSSPSGVQVLVRSGNSLTGAYEHETAGYLAPGPKGERIYSFHGIWTKEATVVNSSDRGGKIVFPSVHGDYYLTREPDPRSRKAHKYVLEVFLRDHDQPLLSRSDLKPMFGDIYDRDENAPPLDKCLHLIPSANLLVAVGRSQDVLDLYRVDLEAALAESEIDYLLVTSRPPPVIEAGQSLNYQMKVLSKQGEVTYKLESGPEGMTLGKDGLLKWKVPADMEKQSHAIIILVSDKSGRDVFHTFDLQIVNAK